MQPPPLLPQLQTRSRRNRQVLPLLRVRAGKAGAKQRGALFGPEFQRVTQGELPCGYLSTASQGPVRLVTLECRGCPARRPFRAHGLAIRGDRPSRCSGKFSETFGYPLDGLLTSIRLGSELA